MMKSTIFVLFFLFVLKLGSAQNTVLTLESVQSCDNLDVTTSLTVENLLNVGAMTLEIAFDTAVLDFVTVNNIHPNFSGIIANVQYFPQPKITIIYSSIGGTNLTSGKLLDINFFFKNGFSALSFLPSCELTTPQFQTIPAVYNNGSVGHVINIIQQPQDVIIHQPQSALFTVLAQGALDYQWQQSINGGSSFTNLNNSSIFQGVKTSELIITSTNSFLDGRLFRCKIATDDCFNFSEPALLTVLPPMIEQDFTFSKGWNTLATYIDPADSDLTELFSPIMDRLIIMVSGDQIYYPDNGINTIGAFDPSLGYILKLSDDATFTIIGEKNNTNQISLQEGWNYLPVISDCGIDIETLFDNNLDKVRIIKEIDGTKVFWPEQNVFSLQWLSPGKAYFIKVSEMVNVIFPDCE